MEQNSEGRQPPSSPTKRATIAPSILYIIPEMPAKLNAQTSVHIHTNNTQSHIISASVIYCSITNFVPENSTFLISKSVGRQSRCSLLGPLLWGLSQAAVKVSLRAVFSSQGLTGGQMCFHAHTVVGRMQFFVDYRTDALSFLLTVGRRLPSVPCHR